MNLPSWVVASRRSGCSISNYEPRSEILSPEIWSRYVVVRRTAAEWPDCSFPGEHANSVPEICRQRSCNLIYIQICYSNSLIWSGLNTGVGTGDTRECSHKQPLRFTNRQKWTLFIKHCSIIKKEVILNFLSIVIINNPREWLPFDRLKVLRIETECIAQ